MEDTQTWIEQAQEAVGAGDKAAARRLLAQVLKSNPGEETAWLLMASAVDSEQQRRECLQRVLAIDPHNGPARRALERMEHVVSPPQPTVGGRPSTASPPPVTPAEDGLRCETCGRPLGPKLLTCPRRAEDGCPYRVERSPVLGSTGMGWVFLGVGWVVWIVGAILAPSSLVGIGLFGLVFTIVGLLIAFGTRVTLYNTTTGQMWEQSQFFGWGVGHKTASAWEPVGSGLQVAPPTSYPASVSLLYQHNDVERRNPEAWIDYATDVFYATLLSLSSRRVVQIYRTTVSSRASSSPQRMFILRPGSAHSQVTVSGELEQHVAQAVVEWSQQTTPTIHVKRNNQGYVRQLRHCLTLHDLMILIVEGDWRNPGEWLISDIVGVDAGRRGVGQSKGRLIKRYRLSTADRRVLLESYAVVYDLRRRFETSQPDVARQLYQAIRHALVARMDTD